MSTLLIQVIEAAKTLPEEQLREVSNFIKALKNQVAHKNLSQPPGGKELLEIMKNEGLTFLKHLKLHLTSFLHYQQAIEGQEKILPQQF